MVTTVNFHIIFFWNMNYLGIIFQTFTQKEGGHQLTTVFSLLSGVIRVPA